MNQARPSKKNIPSLAVIGPGALGCLLASNLSIHGFPVVLVDYRSERAKRLSRTGITVLRDKDGITAFPPVSASSESVGPQDWIIVLVKATRTYDILDSLKHMVQPETIVLSLQNGIGHEDILSRAVRKENIAIGVTSQGATLLEEGKIIHAGKGLTRIGPAVRRESCARRLVPLAEIFSRVGWPASVVSDIRPDVWKKLIINSGINALSALSGVSNGELLVYEESRKLMEMAVSEVWHLSRRKGIDLGLSLDEAVEKVFEVCRATSDNRSSMLQDRIKRKTTEIEYINGAVCSMAGKYQMAAPVNELLTLLVNLNTRLGWKYPDLASASTNV